jgi:3-methyladenine DNA glycosylase AlkD
MTKRSKLRTAPPSTLRAVRADLRSRADAEDAVNLMRFFKTAPGQYGHGDQFLGIRVPVLRELARTHRSLSVDDTLTLLISKWHEERSLALFMLVSHYKRADRPAKQRIYDAYLANTRYINNWDLVDCSAEHIVGPHVGPNAAPILDQLAVSDDVWERRIAMLATFHWIKQKQFAPALRIAEQLVDDDHDLIHKAVGWMLREIGKRDGKVERQFLNEHHRTMPRTMLRYAIEKFPEAERRHYLDGTVNA